MNSQYIDKNGKIPKPGDKIRFDLYDGISNIEFIVRKDDQYGLFPPTMKYLSFEIIS